MLSWQEEVELIKAGKCPACDGLGVECGTCGAEDVPHDCKKEMQICTTCSWWLSEQITPEARNKRNSKRKKFEELNAQDKL